MFQTLIVKDSQGNKEDVKEDVTTPLSVSNPYRQRQSGKYGEWKFKAIGKEFQTLIVKDSQGNK